MPAKIGVTGGIGSGKSYVCGILEKMGYPVYYSDYESKRLTETSSIIREGLIKLLGGEVYLEDKLNKNFLASKIFNDDFIRVQVNEVIHPVVRADFRRWAEEQKSPFVFNEAAILIETGTYKTLDYTVLVTAVEELRVQRTMERDNISREEVLSRMSKQWKDDEKIGYANFVVYNDGSPLLIQLEELEQQLQLLNK